MSHLQLDYTCFKYSDFNFLLIKIPNSILTDVATAQEYNSSYGDFIFNLNPNIQIINNKNSFLIYSGSNIVLQLTNISQEIILDWMKNKKFIIKFVRESTNISTVDNDTLKLQPNIIGVMQVN